VILRNTLFTERTSAGLQKKGNVIHLD